MDLIRLENIRKTYHLGEIDVPVLKGVSLTIGQGEMVALMGASGSGKTTLMNILGCLDRPTSGQYWLDGQEMSDLAPNQRALIRSAKLGFVFQSFNLLPRTTALHNVRHAVGLPAATGLPRQSRARLAQRLLNHVGLADRIDHEPSQMSGGQQQRRGHRPGAVNRPALLLADEPTGNLDSRTSVEILQMFQQLNAEGITVILVTHDPKVAAYAHRTIRIVDGLVEADEACRPAAWRLSRRRTRRRDRSCPACISGWPVPPPLGTGDGGHVLTAARAFAAAPAAASQGGPAVKAAAVRADGPHAPPRPRKAAGPRLPTTFRTALISAAAAS